MQKTLLALNDDELTREDFEPAFIYEKVAEFIKPSKLSADDLNKTGGEDEEDQPDDSIKKPDNAEEVKQ